MLPGASVFLFCSLFLSFKTFSSLCCFYPRDKNGFFCPRDKNEISSFLLEVSVLWEYLNFKRREWGQSLTQRNGSILGKHSEFLKFHLNRICRSPRCYCWPGFSLPYCMGAHFLLITSLFQNVSLPPNGDQQTDGNFMRSGLGKDARPVFTRCRPRSFNHVWIVCSFSASTASSQATENIRITVTTDVIVTE